MAQDMKVYLLPIQRYSHSIDSSMSFIFPTGQWEEDFRSGKGTYTYANGDTYEGQWSNNLRHGNGTYTYAASGVRYDGSWVNGRREGDGELVYGNYNYRGHFTGDQVAADVLLCCQPIYNVQCCS